jgi:hypothetical protein
MAVEGGDRFDQGGGILGLWRKWRSRKALKQDRKREGGESDVA